MNHIVINIKFDSSRGYLGEKSKFTFGFSPSEVENPKEDACRKELEAVKKEFALQQKELELVKENNMLLKTLHGQPKRGKETGKSKRKD